MGEQSSSKRKKKKYSSDDTTSPSSSPSATSASSDSDDESPVKRHKSSSSSRSHHREEKTSRRDKEKRREKERRRRKKKEREKEKRRDRKRGSRRDGKKKKVSDSDSESESDDPKEEDPVDVVRYILNEFPAVSNDLEQLLQMIDDGQAVDIRGLSERSLVKHLRRLFLSLNLKENGQLVFVLPSDVTPTLEVVGGIIRPKMEPEKQQLNDIASEGDNPPVFPSEEGRPVSDDTNVPCPQDDAAGPKKRVIGPAMPSAELLAAAAKLTEAEAELRDAEMDEDSEYFIGPPPPAVVKEAASANEAERFEEITRIMGAEVDNPYDVVGVNRHMSADNIKKRYWKLSLMVHPDKCAHPQAHQAFIKLNKSFKELQDPEKRKAMDEKIDLKEEQERFKVELKAMREAAQWRRLQGISLEGDDILLADLDAKEERRRDEWMTTLPPERKPGGMPTHSTSFSRTAKEGRGDTSAWTETPSERAQKAKMNYLEAYNQAAALASNEEGKKTTDADAELVDKYNKAKRSKSLVEKHQEAARSRTKKKKATSSSSSKKEEAKDTWEGQHPWKPWDRDKDLTAGRQNVKLDADNMSQGLTSRFSSGSFQRNFL